jgi:CheY-like chemotaxis protein
VNQQATLTRTGKVGWLMTQAVPLVLIAEDDPQSMYLMERYTRTCGCQPIGTTNGESVVVLAREKKPAVIFLDLMFPGISGWQILRALRTDPATRSIPVIICTALDEADRALAEGVGYRHKPILYQDFVTALKDAGIEPPNG